MTDEQKDEFACPSFRELGLNVPSPSAFAKALRKSFEAQKEKDLAAATKPLLERIAALEAKLAQRVPEGYELVAVKGLGPLVSALDRADRKGYLPFALEEEWEGFDYQKVSAAPAKPEQAVQPMKDPLHDDIQSVLFEVEQAIENGVCPWQIESAFEAYEAARRLQLPAAPEQQEPN